MAAQSFKLSSRDKQMVLKELGCQTDIDSALNELGMLSAVTNSRHEYLQEKLKNNRSSQKESSPPLCILQMNSDYVTNFSFSECASISNNRQHTSEAAHSSGYFVKFGSNNVWSLKDKRIADYKRHLLRKTPYPLRRVKLKKMSEESDVPLYSSSSSSDTNGSISTNSSISRQDSGNKSNPGSPVKSQKSVTNPRCSIVRSRSLDDLEIGNLSLSDCCSNEAGRAEIETVSQRISNLHVS